MATPNLDSELLKLRRRIGDTYVKATANTLFTTSTSNLDLDGNSITSKELVDIWNGAVKEYLDILLNIPMDSWSRILPGYVLYSLTVVRDSSIGTPILDNADVINYHELCAKSGGTTYYKTKRIMKIVGVLDTYFNQKDSGNLNTVVTGQCIGTYFSPHLLPEVSSKFNAIYANQLMWTVANVKYNSEATSGKYVLLYPKSSGATATYNIVFLRQHDDVVQNSGTDINIDDFTPESLDIILGLSEREYARRRQFDNSAINQQSLQEKLSTLAGGNNVIRTQQ
jgi:hypothetical protein